MSGSETPRGLDLKHGREEGMGIGERSGWYGQVCQTKMALNGNRGDWESIDGECI
jgi:hypothetical protein